jgi:CRISPR-associated endonuclease/helicase Cas3
MFERLLAKSGPDAARTPSMLLPGHLADVHRAAGQVLDATGDDQLRALGLSPEAFRDRFRRVVLLSAAVHDLGKGNDHFQGMLANTRGGQPQGLRHEWATVLMLAEPALRRWLSPAVGSEVDWDIVQWAVAGHHPAYNRASPPQLTVDMDGAGTAIALLMDHEDFRHCLTWLDKTFSLEGAIPDPQRQTRPLVGARNVFTWLAKWSREAAKAWANFTPDEKRFVAAVTNCLIAADVAGSALPRAVQDEVERNSWIARAFANTPPPDRLQRIVERSRRERTLRHFQEEMGRSDAPVTFVRAGCGSGKTLGAYHWAASNYPTHRLYFCYPTTGTATEGYRDYLYDPHEEFDAELFHSRAGVDLDILGVRGDTDDTDGEARISSLDAWSTPIVSCTVDTVLGLVQNNRRGLYAWPALAGAAFVFDEIHAYDDKLFGALLRFLQAFRGVPVLLMTASLPTARLQALQQVLRRRGAELRVVDGPTDLEELPRYQRQGAVDARDPLAEVRAEVERGGKVLWVCNTVDRAIAAASRSADLRPAIYHSRFRYADRVCRHQAVIQAFKPESNPGGALAVCTQVAETSLDLQGVALLVTDLAPVPALIQRLGRLNRRAAPGDPTRPFIVIEPQREDGTPAVLPYTPEDFALARRWEEALGDGPLTQGDLARRWEACDAGRRPALVESAWLDGGPVTQVRELRETSPGITVLLARDAKAVRTGRLAAARAALPMPPPPRGLEWRKWDMVRGLPVAPENAIDYDPNRGAQWRK